MSASVDPRLEAILAGSPSPFSDAVLPNAFRETPDVPQIHRLARERCLALVREARIANRTSLQVILGDAGEGKTHLIAWLRRKAEEGWRKETSGGRFAVTVIPPIRSLSRARHHILQEVVRQLSIRLPDNVHVDAATDTPIEILVWRALLAICRLLLDDRSTPPALRARIEEATSVDPERFLSLSVEQLKDAWKVAGSAIVDAALRLPELAPVDREVFRIVARFPEGEEAERTAIVDWLGGAGLGADRLEALGTSLVLDDEPGAARGLSTLLALARLAGTPVVLAFDQIEGVARLGSEAISEMLGTIAEIYNEAPGTVFLVFCQTQLWPTLHREAANHVRDRLDDAPPLYMKALTPEEAFLLVEARMKHFWQSTPNGPSDPLYPLTRAQVSTDIERVPLRTPRAVLKHFHALVREAPERRSSFTPPSPPAPADIVERKLASLIEEESRTTRPPDSRAALVQSVVRDLLVQASTQKRPIRGATVEEVASHRARKTGLEGLRIVLRRNTDRRTVYVESSNSQHGKSAAATMKRLNDVVASAGADVALLLREEVFPLPPVASKTLLEMTPRGALLRLTERQVVPLAAIEALLNAAAAGDLPVERKTALDIAVEVLAEKLGIVEELVDGAFGSRAEGGDVRPPISAASLVGSGEASVAIAPAALERYVELVLDHLRAERAFEAATQLAACLGISVEKVDGAIHELESRRLVDIVVDRNRAPVVLLRPEGLAR